MSDIGAKIRERRLALGMTQEELAHKVGYKTKGSINKLETTRDVPIKKLKPVADALGISVWELTDWDFDVENSANVAADLTADPELTEYVSKLMQLDSKSKAQIFALIDLLLAK